jgi:hypothetical protein
MADPVAWNMIERGWKVYDAAGEEIGTVAEVTGDENIDIFDGLALESGKYVPSELVKVIVDGEVHLNVTDPQLENYAEPAVQEQILPDGVPWYRRIFGGR